MMAGVGENLVSRNGRLGGTNAPHAAQVHAPSHQLHALPLHNLSHLKGANAQAQHLVHVRPRHNNHHAHAHVEGAEHLGIRHLAGLQRQWQRLRQCRVAAVMPVFVEGKGWQ